MYRDAPPFALDGVYISEPCPNHCGGHGDCISGVCFCDMGYTGKVEYRKEIKRKERQRNFGAIFCLFKLYCLHIFHSGAG